MGWFSDPPKRRKSDAVKLREQRQKVAKLRATAKYRKAAADGKKKIESIRAKIADLRMQRATEADPMKKAEIAVKITEGQIEIKTIQAQVKAAKAAAKRGA